MAHLWNNRRKIHKRHWIPTRAKVKVTKTKAKVMWRKILPPVMRLLHGACKWVAG